MTKSEISFVKIKKKLSLEEQDPMVRNVTTKPVPRFSKKMSINITNLWTISRIPCVLIKKISFSALLSNVAA